MFSKGTLMGTAVVKADGSYSVTVSVPSTLAAGNHTAQVQGFTSATTRTSFSVGVLVKVSKPTTLTIRNFARNSSRLTTPMRRSLAQLAASIVRHVASSVSITGFNDNVGTKVASLIIGRNRAIAVMTFLQSQLKARHYSKLFPIRIVTRGSSAPAKSNATAAGKAANRRVVVTVVLA
jgi:outer membrane protein OmpA-like peptidoglycan-associated protein